MRRSVLFLGPVAAALAAGVLFACEDSGSGSSSGDLPDATSFDGNSASDGPTFDGSVPDAADAAPPASVTVVVTSGGAPEANVTVVFSDMNGAVLESKQTGLDGKASSTVGKTPSMATALLGSGTLLRLLTWTAVEPGDVLFTSDIGSGAPAASYGVTLEGTLSDAGQTSATAAIGACAANAEGTTATVPLTPECLRPTTTILASAFATAGVIGYAYAKGKPAPPADGGAGSATVGPWAFPGTTTVTAKNLPQPAVIASLLDIAGDLPFQSGSGAGVTPDVDGGKATFLVAPGFAEAQQAAVFLAPTDTPGARLLIAKRGAPAANFDIDFSKPLPTLNTAALVTSTLARPQVFWSTVGNAPLTGTDGGSIAVQWTTGDVNAGWTFIVPPTAKTVKAPALPMTANPWLPQPLDDAGLGSFFGTPEVTFIEADVLTGYADFRAQVGRILPHITSTGRDASAVLPVNGTLKATSFALVPQ